MNNIPNINSFLPEEEKALQRHMYFWDFFASLDFDDGWKESSLPHLKEYTETFSQEQKWNFSLQIEKWQDMVHLILSSHSKTPQTLEEISHISQELQSSYALNIFREHVHPLFAAWSTLFPFKMEEPHEDDYFFARYTLQEYLAQIYSLQRDKKRFQHIEGKMESVDAKVKNVEGVYKENVQKNIQHIDVMLSRLQDELPDFVADRYLLLSSRWEKRSNMITLPRYIEKNCKQESEVLDEETIKNLKTFLANNKHFWWKEGAEKKDETPKDLESIEDKFQEYTSFIDKIYSLNEEDLTDVELSREEKLYVEKVKQEICFPIQNILKSHPEETDGNIRALIKNLFSTIEINNFTVKRGENIYSSMKSISVIDVQNDISTTWTEVIVKISDKSKIPCFHKWASWHYTGSHYLKISKSEIDIKNMNNHLLQHSYVYSQIWRYVWEGAKREICNRDHINAFFREGREDLYWDKISLKKLWSIISNIYNASLEHQKIPESVIEDFEELFVSLNPNRLEIDGQTYIKLLQSLNTHGLENIKKYSHEEFSYPISDIHRDGKQIRSYKVKRGWKLYLPWLKKNEEATLQIGEAEEKVRFWKVIHSSKWLGAKRYQEYDLELISSPLFKATCFNALLKKYDISCLYQYKSDILFKFSWKQGDILVSLKWDMKIENKSILPRVHVSLYPIQDTVDTIKKENIDTLLSEIQNIFHDTQKREKDSFDVIL